MKKVVSTLPVEKGDPNDAKAIQKVLSSLKKSTNWRVQDAMKTRLRRDRWLNRWLENVDRY